MKVIIKNIAELVQVEEVIQDKVSGADMKKLATIKDAFLCMEDGLITDFGTMDNWTGIDDWNNTEVVDAEGGMVFPSWVDSHSHLVFGGTREGEFVDRINGLTYEEIANRGGGILNSAKKLANSTEDELYESASTRLIELIKMGTGALEIKSGYGLSTESELKMLRVIKKDGFICFTINEGIYLDYQFDKKMKQLSSDKLWKVINFSKCSYIVNKDIEAWLCIAKKN